MALAYCTISSELQCHYFGKDDRCRIGRKKMDPIWLDRDRVDRELKTVDFADLTYDPGSGSYYHGDEPFCGNCSQRYGDGKLKNVGQFADGVENGVTVVWHPSGAIKTLSELEHGVRHGLLIEWAEDGNKISEKRFREGQLVRT
jgi:hypothetical protein